MQYYFTFFETGTFSSRFFALNKKMSSIREIQEYICMKPKPFLKQDEIVLCPDSNVRIISSGCQKVLQQPANDTFIHIRCAQHLKHAGLWLSKTGNSHAQNRSSCAKHKLCS